MKNKVFGSLDGAELRIGIVLSRFNEVITDQLLKGALETLARSGVKEERIEVVEVPGAFEIPLLAQVLAQKEEIDAVIALGAVIRGETPHFDYVASQVASGLNRVSLDCQKPVIFGVLTTDCMDQALARTGLKLGNKGSEAASTAVEMANLMRALG